MRDYYLILGVGRHADKDRIKRAFRKIAKEQHPDQCAADNSAEKFMEARDAYETLVDDSRREKYDRALRAEEKPAQSSAAGNAPGGRPEARSGRGTAWGGFGEDLFEGMASAFFRKDRPRPDDLFRFELILSPREAREGVDAPVSLPVKTPCPDCRNAGVREAAFCPVCAGRGVVEAEKEFYITIPPDTPHGARFHASLASLGLGRASLEMRVIIDPFEDAGA